MMMRFLQRANPQSHRSVLGCWMRAFVRAAALCSVLPMCVRILEGGYMPYNYHYIPPPPYVPAPPPAPPAVWYPPPPPMPPPKPKLPKVPEVRYMGKGTVTRIGHGKDVELVCNFQGPDVKIISNIVWVKVKDPYHPMMKTAYTNTYGPPPPPPPAPPSYYKSGYDKRYKRSGYKGYDTGGYGSAGGMGGNAMGTMDSGMGYGSMGSGYSGSNYNYGGYNPSSYYPYTTYKGYRSYGSWSDPHGFGHPYYPYYYSPLYYCHHCIYQTIGPNEPKHQVENFGPKSILRIRDVTPEDFGIYRCSATSQKSIKSGETEQVYQVIEFFQ